MYLLSEPKTSQTCQKSSKLLDTKLSMFLSYHPLDYLPRMEIFPSSLSRICPISFQFFYSISSFWDCTLRSQPVTVITYIRYQGFNSIKIQAKGGMPVAFADFEVYFLFNCFSNIPRVRKPSTTNPL